MTAQSVPLTHEYPRSALDGIASVRVNQKDKDNADA